MADNGAIRKAWRVYDAVQARVYRRRGVAMAVPPGHFYSPVPSLTEVRERREAIFGPSELLGIDVRTEAQMEFVRELSVNYSAHPFTAGARTDLRYYFENPFFGYGDGLMLHLILRHQQPKRVIEIGSGYSSAAILDTVDLHLPDAECTFVEPNSDRLHGLLRDTDTDQHRVIERPVQDVDISTFTALEAGDVLFVDSSHVSKVGSDVNYLVFEVFPRLAPGTLIHVHDIFYPFEYPESWVLGEGRAWTEAYLLRALLMNNPSFEIVLWNSYLEQRHRREVAERLPLWDLGPGGSIWLRRL